MAMTLPNLAENNLLNLITNNLPNGGAWVVALYQEAIELDQDTLLATLLDAECDYTGYTSQGFSWNAAETNEDTGSGESLSGDNLLFAHSGSGTSNDVWGYFIYYNYSSTNYLIGAEQFADAPRTMTVLGDSFTITPCLTLAAEIEA